MKKRTVLLVEIEHSKELPQRRDISDIAAQRIYGYLYSEGVEVTVKAKRLRVESVDHGSSIEGSVCDV